MARSHSCYLFCLLSLTLFQFSFRVFTKKEKGKEKNGKSMKPVLTRCRALTIKLLCQTLRRMDHWVSSISWCFLLYNSRAGLLSVFYFSFYIRANQNSIIYCAQRNIIDLRLKTLFQCCRIRKRKWPAKENCDTKD